MTQTAIRDLTMLLLYMTAWEEGDSKRAWKGHDWDALDQLIEEGLIEGQRRNKSVWITEEGEAEARRIASRYGIDQPGS
jgi:DNA-binding PadR family transcriptional regulator